MSNRRWMMDFTSKGRDLIADLPSPPGYTPSVSQMVETVQAKDESLIIKRSWDMALSPFKQIPMNLFMMYMAGDSISLFPLMMIGMMVVRSLRSLFEVQASFRLILGRHALLQRTAYLLGNVTNLVLALWKCQSLGLLPTHSSDWLAFVEPQQHAQVSLGGVAMM